VQDQFEAPPTDEEMIARFLSNDLEAAATAKLLRQVLEELRRSHQVFQVQSQQLAPALESAVQCQRSTAEILNRSYERHELHPAIRAAWSSMEELTRLDQMIQAATSRSPGCQAIESLAKASRLAAELAEEQVSCLGATAICPRARDQLDVSKQEPVAATGTEDQGLHGRVAEVITPGLEYRGEVLRRARVRVFRFGPPTGPGKDGANEPH
jgi:molecular chaperone GrpE (heat shock protein)